MRLSHIPLRLTTGAFILNSGVGKLSADDDAAKRYHDMASGTYPMFSSIEPTTFTKMLAVGEIAVGSVLLLPIVPAAVAGAALTGFSGALVRMYLKTPGMTKEDGVRPTQQGTPFAKDFWMLGAGLALLADGLAPRRKTRKAARRALAKPVRQAAVARGAAKGYVKGMRHR